VNDDALPLFYIILIVVIRFLKKKRPPFPEVSLKFNDYLYPLMLIIPVALSTVPTAQI
jgi:hypothetical protein